MDSTSSHLHALCINLNALEEAVGKLVTGFGNLDFGESVLAVGVRLDLALVGQGDLLKTVADTKNRNPVVKDGGVDTRRVVVVDRVRRAGEDDTWLRYFSPMMLAHPWVSM